MRYPPISPQLKYSRPATKRSLSDAQVVVVCNRKFRGESAVSYSRRRSMEVNTGQREFKAGCSHGTKRVWEES